MRSRFKRGIHTLRMTGALRERRPIKNEVMLVQPDSIRWHMIRHSWRNLVRQTGFKGGTFADGNWDTQGLETWESDEDGHSCFKRWVLGDRWEETEEFMGYVDKLENGVPNRFADRAALLNRYRNLDAIFGSVIRGGRMSEAIDDLVRVSVGRDGVLAWGPDGRHRICIARIAGLERMPVRVGFVHVGALDAFEEIRTHRMARGSASPPTK